jgi:GrpB-like predicted nucleotidyltransferase (UPF0157 family)
MEDAGGGPGLSRSRAEQTAGSQGGDPFAEWCRLRASQGDRASLIRLYAMVAEPRGLAAHELPLAERKELGTRAMAVVFPGWEIVPGSDRHVEPVAVVPYDPAWATAFESWRDRLAGRLGRAALRIEHVGSTSVPGLAAKPVIDVQVSVASLGDEGGYVPACRAAGLQFRSRDDAHRFFRPPAGRPRDVHVHVCAVGSSWERGHLLFRDFLRADTAGRDRYAAMKRQAARLWHDDRVGYTEAKNDVILDLLDQAELWAAAHGWTI